jgi:hypothetical protein
MNTIKIYETTETIQSEDGGMMGYQAYNCSGRGKHVATITGEIEKVKSWCDSDLIKMEGGEWAIRDIVSLAKQGKHGLKIA